MGRGSHRRKTPLWKRGFKWIAFLLVLLLVAAGGAGWYFMNRFEGNIKTEGFINSPNSNPRPVALPSVEGALNILLMGSDDRKDTGIAGETPGLSDTTILLHISKNRDYAYGISIPRDAMVERPACPRRDGEGEAPAEFAQFNSAFAVGGPACTVATVEALSNVRIDHFVVVDFNSFRSMVDAVGGVKMCVPQDVNDPIGNIHLKAGTYNMNGETALDYVRVRHGIGVELGDIGRMKRQQAFLAALVEKVQSKGTLFNPVAMISFMEAATNGITTDPGFSDVQKLASLALSLKNIGMENVEFVTAPFELWSQDRNRVVLTEEAQDYWTMAREDQRLTDARDVIKGEGKAKKESVLWPPPKYNPDSSNETVTGEGRQAYGLCS